MSTIQINDGLASAQAILLNARVGVANNNTPAWSMLRRIANYLEAQQVALLNDCKGEAW